MTQTAIVVGSGLSGLAAAVALAESDWDVTVLERSSEPGTTPLGLALTRNGIQALAELGVSEEVERAGTRTRMGEVRSSSDAELLAEGSTDAGDVVAIHHDTLRGIIADRAADLGVTVEHGRNVRSDADLPSADLVIGADGIRSVVRGWIKPRVRPDYSGSTCWHGIAARGDSTPSSLVSWVAQGLEAGIMPIDDDRAYWYIAKVARMGGGGDEPAGEAVLESAAVEGPLSGHVLATDPDQVRRTDLWHLPTGLPRFTSVRTGVPTMLVGDAAHAMVPALAQGANQAFEDAATLKALLEQELSTDELFERYNEERVGRAQRMQQRSLDMMRLLQADGPVCGPARNLALKTVPTLAVEVLMDWHSSWWDPRRKR